MIEDVHESIRLDHDDVLHKILGPVADAASFLMEVGLKWPNATLHIEPVSAWGDCEGVTAWITSPSTPEEIAAEEAQQAEHRAEMRQNRYQQYLTLKQEFENVQETLC